MSQERTEAVVLHGVDFKESSRIVTFISPTRGRLSCLAAGARRAKRSLSSILDNYNRVEIVYYWKDEREVQPLSEAYLIHGYPNIKADFLKSLYTAFPIELVYRIVQKNEPAKELYATLVKGLDSMEEWQGDPVDHVVWQVMCLMSSAGFAPQLRGVENAVGFDFDSGMTKDISSVDQSISEDLLRDLHVLSESQSHCPELKNSIAVFQLLRGFVIRQIEADFRSLRVLDQVLRRR